MVKKLPILRAQVPLLLKPCISEYLAASLGVKPKPSNDIQILFFVVGVRN
jgi:hypothetical protein